MELARSGGIVICADLDEQKGAAVVEDAKRSNFRIEYLRIDLADPASIRNAAADVLARHSRVDILVNAAGWNDIQPFVDNAPDYMERVLAINLGGTLHLTQALLPAMMAAGKGKIVNVSSDAGRVGSSGETTYAAAKGGVIAFTKSLAREVARNAINVNCVCPGPTDTPMLATRPEKLREAFLKAIPFRRFAKPEEVADAILFFASSRSDYITGQVMSVSGGLTFAG
jgi:2-hydroxycyclohexanecarboxyl-CoA dehydrogenase